jgi:hypothetical protein
MPAPRPAERKSEGKHRPSRRKERTQENIANSSLSSLGVCKPALVRLETRKPSCHLWNDAGKYSAEALVQREGRLAPHNHGTSGNEATGFRLCMKV